MDLDSEFSDMPISSDFTFRLSWPGEMVAPVVAKKAKKKGKLAQAGRKLMEIGHHPMILAPLKMSPMKFRKDHKGAHPRRRPGKLAALFPMLGLPALGRKLKARRSPCLGWPITLSAPGPELPPFSPKVKITGKPLD